MPTFRTVRYVLLVAVVSVTLSHAAWSAPKIDLNVLYLGVPADTRTADFSAFLSEHFTNAQSMDREAFKAKAPDPDVDVVLLDWHQGEGPFPARKSYLGKWGELKTPTVLLGSAGLLHAVASELRGGHG